MACLKHDVNMWERKGRKMSNKKPNTSKIIELAKQKSKDAEKQVFSTIKSMIKNRKAINFNTVSKESMVSKSFLYKNTGIRNKIDMLRNEQGNLKNVINHKSNTSEKSKDIIIESLKFKIEHLEKENKELKEALETKYSEDRKSTRLNSSHVAISYAVFCLKKKKKKRYIQNKNLKHTQHQE